MKPYDGEGVDCERRIVVFEWTKGRFFARVLANDLGR